MNNYFFAHKKKTHCNITFLSGIDGHACVLRGICEVALAPEHDEGLMGDTLSMLLTVSNTINTLTHVRGTEDVYVEAQANGQVNEKRFYTRETLRGIRIVP